MEQLVNYYFNVRPTNRVEDNFIGPVLIDLQNKKIYTIFEGEIMSTKKVLKIIRESFNETDIVGHIIYRSDMYEFLNSKIK